MRRRHYRKLWLVLSLAGSVAAAAWAWQVQAGDEAIDPEKRRLQSQRAELEEALRTRQRDRRQAEAAVKAREAASSASPQVHAHSATAHSVARPPSSLAATPVSPLLHDPALQNQLLASMRANLPGRYAPALTRMALTEAQQRQLLDLIFQRDEKRLDLDDIVQSHQLTEKDPVIQRMRDKAERAFYSGVATLLGDDAGVFFCRLRTPLAGLGAGEPVRRCGGAGEPAADAGPGGAAQRQPRRGEFLLSRRWFGRPQYDRLAAGAADLGHRAYARAVPVLPQLRARLSGARGVLASGARRSAARLSDVSDADKFSMKTLSFLLRLVGLGLLGAFGLAAHPAQAQGFFRAGGLFVGYTDSEFSSEAGGSVAGGWNWGAAEEHEGSIEVAFSSWKWNKPILTTPSGSIGFRGDGNWTPILFNYRYYLGRSEARVRFYGGVSAGVTLLSGDVEFRGSGALYGGKADKTVGTFGATVGLAGQFSPTVGYDLGYRYLAVDGFDVATTGATIILPKTSAHVVSVSIRLRF